MPGGTESTRGVRRGPVRFRPPLVQVSWRARGGAEERPVMWAASVCGTTPSERPGREPVRREKPAPCLLGDRMGHASLDMEGTPAMVRMPAAALGWA